MSQQFQTNVFIRGAIALYQVRHLEGTTYQLSLQFCRLKENPPPALFRIRQTGESQWEPVDLIDDEFMFIVSEIGSRIHFKLPQAVNA